MRIAIGLGITAIAILFAGRRILFLFRLVKSGTGSFARRSTVTSQIEAELVEVLGQKKLLKKLVPGLAHFFTFWGFLVLLATVLEAYGTLFKNNFAIPFIGHDSWLGFLEDFFSTSVLLALIAFAAIRIQNSPSRKMKSSRFYGSHLGAAWLVLVSIALVVVTLLIYRGAQINDGSFPFGHFAFASYLTANAIAPLGISANKVLEAIFVEMNIAVIMAFLVFVTYSKHLHIFAAPINIAFSRRPNALGALATTPNMDPETLTEDASFGVGKIQDFSWKQLLDLVTCTECGRCQEQCPAWNTGKALSPKLLITDLRDHLFSQANILVKPTNNLDGELGPTTRAATQLVPDVISKEVLWSCTTCGACVQACPVDIEHVDAIIDMRRYQVLMESDFPSEASSMLRNIENFGDPWGLGQRHRLDWVTELDFEVMVVTDEIPESIEYLFWVGCAGALDERARKVTQSIARLLHRANVGFAVLGPKETCTGDPARRLGNEYLYQTQAAQNIETLNALKPKKIIASCAHCFNSIANEYKDLGGNFEVIHHTQLLNTLTKASAFGSIASGMAERITFHDPCYLGRHNRIFADPRGALSSIDNTSLVEMSRNKEQSFCCGAGGARMWLEESVGTRVNSARIDQGLATTPDVIATACPYCLIMLDDGLKAKQTDGLASDQIMVLDVAQVLDRAITASNQDKL